MKDAIMKKVIKYNYYLLLFILLSSCASPYGNTSTQRNENYKIMLNSWKGVDINLLFNSWGQPTKEYIMPNGNIMYTFNEYSGAYVCNTTMITNKKYKIINWSFNGNGCQTSFKPTK